MKKKMDTFDKVANMVIFYTHEVLEVTKNLGRQTPFENPAFLVQFVTAVYRAAPFVLVEHAAADHADERDTRRRLARLIASCFLVDGFVGASGWPSLAGVDSATLLTNVLSWTPEERAEFESLLDDVDAALLGQARGVCDERREIGGGALECCDEEDCKNNLLLSEARRAMAWYAEGVKAKDFVPLDDFSHRDDADDGPEMNVALAGNTISFAAFAATRRRKGDLLN